MQKWLWDQASLKESTYEFQVIFKGSLQNVSKNEFVML